MNELKRIYRISDGSVIQLADELLIYANRDATEFGAYGYDAAKLASIAQMRQDFAEIRTDEELSGLMVTATATKNAKKKELRSVIKKDIAQRFANKYGDDSGRYRMLGVSGLSKQRDSDLVQTSRSCQRTAITYLADMVGTGLTQQVIDDFVAVSIEFDDEIDNQKKAIANRDLEVEMRIQSGNALYAELVKMADTGKSIWLDESEAKYNDYVITETKPKGTQTVQGTVEANGGLMNPSLTGVKESSELTLKNTGTGPLEFYFHADPVEPPEEGQPVITVAAGEESTHAATDMHFHPTDRTRLNVRNNHTEVGSYEIEMV